MFVWSLLLSIGVAILYFASAFSLHSPFFFFYCDGHHRDLHSFPTRRSSDLSFFSKLRSSGSTVILNCFDARSDETEDRKSTRLNSSHVRISYAVFCLKKKKKFENFPLYVYKSIQTICYTCRDHYL